MDRFKQRARKLRAAQTNAEARLRRALRGRRLSRWKFRRQHTIDRFTVDFVTLEGKLIVEVDGWETHRTRMAFHDDRRRDQLLRLAGWDVLRFTGREVSRDADHVTGLVRTILERATNELAAK